ncbi:MAG: SpoIIE family protein phosphatase [Marinilabiliaceae bacterium]|nr:SpoIIE family protein phosphatase [Marinilabiliaceae bacterium]
MKLITLKPILFTMFLCIALIANAQSFRFRNYDSNMGLPQNFVYCVEQGLDGYLWIGTGEGLVKYDGHNFRTFLTTDNLAEDFIMDLHIAIDGKVWIGHNAGTFSYFKNNKFFPIEIPDANSSVRSICQDKSESIWAVVQNSGIVRIDKNLNVTTFFDKEKLDFGLNFYSICPITEKTLLVGTTEGLLKVTINDNNEIISAIEIEDIPQTKITTIKPRKGIIGEYWVGTEYEGFYRFFAGSSQATQISDNRLCLNFDLENETIQDIVEENDGHLLLATWGNGVIKLFFDPVKQDFTESFNFSSANGLKSRDADYVRSILCDSEGNYWFATFGAGLFLLVDESNVFYNLSDIGFVDYKAVSVYKTDESFYFGLDNGFIKADPYCYTDFELFDIQFGIPRDEVIDFYKSEDGSLWVATGNNGLYVQKPNQKNFIPYRYTDNLTGKKIRDMKGHGNSLYLATIGGYFEINTHSGEIIHLNTERGLPHNNINFVYRDSQGHIWIGPKNMGICKIVKSDIELHKISLDISGIAEDLDGNFWLATQGRGVAKFVGDSLQFITIAEGLAKNFCYKIALDQSNRLWVLHFPGMSCINLDDFKIKTFGYEENMGADFYDVFEDKYRNLWFASSQGVINYFPLKDHENSIPPKLNFTKIIISGKEYEITDIIKLSYPWKEKYVIHLDFMGISFKDPKGVTYQYQLEQEGDKPTDWINLPTTWWEREYLPDGNWILKIRAFNSDGVYNIEPLTIKIQIAAPPWKKGWFYLVTIPVFLFLIYLVINVRERKLRHQKEQLEKEVANQTVILRQQKAEIERKNRDITDSINYAKRIQTSILPPADILEARFPESFIYFAPRDIVSGDFYWVTELKGKIMCCCADCTGHGVPGAFMSMIGSTLLSDIVKRPEISSPADILSRLDFEIKILLQKNTKELSQDGMDIAIVEIDLQTYKIRIASAKRPVYLYFNDELTIYKGVRRSIGDHVTDYNAPPFVNIEYDGKSKDKIYLFSDGYADQFGGPHGKKLMISAVKDMLDEIHKKPMKEQFFIIKNNFINWKNNQEQVDDVIFIGIGL